MFEYSQRAFETQYSIIKDILINGKIPNVYPKAYILGGQPGAGKSNIQRWLKRKDKNIIAINADDFRVYHPLFLIFKLSTEKILQNIRNPLSTKLQKD